MARAPFPKPIIANPAAPTLAESVMSTAWLFAEAKRIFLLQEDTIMDIFRTSMMFMQNDQIALPDLTDGEEDEVITGEPAEEAND